MAKLPMTSAILTNRFERRTFVLGALQGGVGVLLATRLGFLAVAQNEKYQAASESNRVNLTLIPPRRGWVLDRFGKPLASNRADFRVDLIPDRMANPEQTLQTLAGLLSLPPDRVRDIRDRMDKARGFQPVEVAASLDWDKFAAVSVRLPELPGVIPQKGYSRFYPYGAAVGHMVGYVGAASAEDYEKERNALLVTPGFKIGKDGLEKHFEARLRGVPGARRVEATASGRIVRDLGTREDVPGKPIQLTINAGLQDYAARRIGLESGSVVVMDCETGDILAMASMPSFDPNSFSDGIGRIEWKMLSEDDHVPLRNKVLRGLYPPGSTVKPMVAMAFLEAGLDPSASVGCGGGLRVGNRVFHCWNRRGHGSVDMAKGIYQSCDVYFYHFAQKIGMDKIAAMARRLGLGQEFPMPYPGQSYGTVPDPAWKQKKYGKEWAVYDTVNATIGQGYMLVNPLQQAVMSARIASGREVMPRLLLDRNAPLPKPMGFRQDHLDFIHAAMSEVVNGRGTAGRAKLPVDVLMAGKTGTAQVVGLNLSNGKSGIWKYRDHGHFIAFAPFDKPKYACAVVIEHGGGSGAAYPIARDVMTYIFDQGKAMAVLEEFEKQWGGNVQQRMAARYDLFAAKYGATAPKPVPDDAELTERADAARKPAGEPAIAQTAAASPAPEPEQAGAGATPVAGPSPTASATAAAGAQ
ncbi:MAG: penicillin-binding protein 2 [Novosphingobium sp. 28-62-57]|uniref:penicillin-binding protein 2 n=1 Tax=unclassified Novosphingobium TaxID=2644732 RepID=UPI000BD94A46|nr:MULTISPECIES: penicillin-binding protein 2 [unclassified Novosphingobium]OYW49506.1 MAG: penicillin-binding protein 2 [Novosphingobium sp. 12-62-10]OYZ12538.1 MAG: penicillin-binding protein 2 [Novosphingobium sp. 28-62-57]OYZ98828.1 MAG: penicillin-binding protein 2 [Novosphingobium sp. 17-62-8]HQS71030.1 penicillin-binding protein 2 [Novosphingobium sp.]